jgi:hypothetical protein
MRNTKTIIIERDGRDKGKMFMLTEMSAWNTNRWGLNCAKQLAKSGVELPQELVDMGIGGIINGIRNAVANPTEEGDFYTTSLLKAFLYLMANVDEDQLFKLLSDLIECVQLQTTDGAIIQLLPEHHIEESSTFNTLYKEVFQLHSFF